MQLSGKLLKNKVDANLDGYGVLITCLKYSFKML